MFCPNCGSTNIGQNMDDEMLGSGHCFECGADFPECAFRTDEPSLCEYGDHDWQEHLCADGESYAQCTYCGLIDD
jgi:hypothetical protein